ncbi:MAG TPA: aldo/keto reductase [Wenzhouxiangellaceae bacterium]|nr:aldo/keto reductase [Wenzhouxiangellaceae bacterium]
MKFDAGRRRTIKVIAAGMASASLGPELLRAPDASSMTAPMTGTIQSSGRRLPVIGMGTWQTFNVGGDEQLRLARTEVVRAFVEHGGGMVDCSPMYGSSAAVMGFALERLGAAESVFSAEKVWTRDADQTRDQIAGQAAEWGLERFDLMQVHNLLGWEAHLETLFEMKRKDEIGHVGVTTSHGRRHAELERVMERQPLDFVQLTYNVTHREAEQRLLPLARDKGIAVIANRPYDGGRLIKGIQTRHEVPGWAIDAFDCRNWADFLLKFIVSHPAITCAIPATTQVQHMHENMRAGRGPMPTPELRERMVRHVESL